MREWDSDEHLIERLRSDEPPTQEGSEEPVLKSKHSLITLDARSDTTQNILEWVVVCGLGLLALGILAGWVGGLLYIVHLVFGD